MDVLCPADEAAAVTAILPPGHVSADPRDAAETQMELKHAASGAFTVSADGHDVLESSNREIALGAMDAQIRAYIALNAPDRIFVHAGVVAVGEVAMLLPGSSFAGKTTLVAALVRAGASYYSDEFAVLDDAGFVHPYPKPLSVRRNGTGDSVEVPAASLGGATGDEAIPVGLIAVTSFRSGAVFDPDPLSAGAATLALLEHTVPARARPTQSMAFLSRAAVGASAIRGVRGEADVTAAALMATLG
jgi:hypothetical protein